MTSAEHEALLIVREALDRGMPLLPVGSDLHGRFSRARWGCCVFLGENPPTAVPHGAPPDKAVSDQ